MSDHVMPQTKHPKLIVVVAFDRGEDGEPFPAFGPGPISRLRNARSEPPRDLPISMPV
jgi:hypothetical protein